MLHKETVEPATLDLIRQLQGDPELGGFFLVGGTALSLLLGHRISIDVDLFSQQDFDAPMLLQHLEKNYAFSLQYMHRNTLKGLINNVFVDLITHPYPMIGEPVMHEAVILMSKEDIAAMKVNAITGNGTRAKDFVDVYFLLKEFTIMDLIGFYSQKYAQRNTFHALKSMIYFDDMDCAAWPNMLREKTLTPDLLKKELITKCEGYLHHFCS
ncbi:MAG: nucleotidyl transferase AbiEii/AbiGii toxin family protein [Bacteroidales bacterium]|nr:nucleotidyl transferase AbiEii/AbiGii toxin family protein [Bacteroidales bacterium]